MRTLKRTFCDFFAVVSVLPGLAGLKQARKKSWNVSGSSGLNAMGSCSRLKDELSYPLLQPTFPIGKQETAPASLACQFLDLVRTPIMHSPGTDPKFKRRLGQQKEEANMK